MKLSSLSKVKDSPYYLLYLSLSSVVLFWLSWPVMPFTPLIFLAFVPLLEIENHLAVYKYKAGGKKFFFAIYLAFFFINLTTTWWVYKASLAGAVVMVFANAFLMCIPFLLFRITKKAAGTSWGYFGLVLYWLAFENIHLSWDLSWPWLTIGNVFATNPEWVQWYSATGVPGGTLWVLLVNILLYFAIFHHEALYRGMFRKVTLTYAMLLIIIPIVVGYISYYSYDEQGEAHEMVILQPNIDPYTQKFEGSSEFIPFEQQLDRFLAMSEEKISPETDFLIWPETALDKNIEEARAKNDPIIQRIMAFKDQYPNLTMLTGLVTYTRYVNESDITTSARYVENSGYYDVFNSGLFLKEDNELQFYHKSRLVPGVETLPYPQVTRVIQDILFDLGGTSGGYGKQAERTVFANRDSVMVAPSICYESIFGDFMSQFVRNGANYIFIITNDGWWGKTPGLQQHLHYARLRAVETRRSIARSANTGISAFINQRGDITARSGSWVPDVLTGSIQANDKLTFYAIYGDFISRTAVWLSVFVFLAAIVKRKIV